MSKLVPAILFVAFCIGVIVIGYGVLNGIHAYSLASRALDAWCNSGVEEGGIFRGSACDFFPGVSVDFLVWTGSYSYTMTFIGGAQYVYTVEGAAARSLWYPAFGLIIVGLVLVTPLTIQISKRVWILWTRLDVYMLKRMGTAQLCLDVFLTSNSFEEK